MFKEEEEEDTQGLAQIKKKIPQYRLPPVRPAPSQAYYRPCRGAEPREQTHVHTAVSECEVTSHASVHLCYIKAHPPWGAYLRPP